jgi:hypothetical protein
MLVETGLLCVLLTKEPDRCEAGKRVLDMSNVTSCSLVVSGEKFVEAEVYEGADLDIALARDLAIVKEVRHVLVERADGNLLVWIALDNPVREVREQLFQRELSLIEDFPEIEFDFNIIPGTNSEPSRIASGARVVYSREDSDIAKQG